MRRVKNPRYRPAGATCRRHSARLESQHLFSGFYISLKLTRLHHPAACNPAICRRAC